MLFVAHRKEIPEQSLRTYREVLGDADFAGLYVAGHRPERWQHIFTSVQALTAYGVERIPAEAFTVVVIDKFHHANSNTSATKWRSAPPPEDHSQHQRSVTRDTS